MEIYGALSQLRGCLFVSKNAAVFLPNLQDTTGVAYSWWKLVTIAIHSMVVSYLMVHSGGPFLTYCVMHVHFLTLCIDEDCLEMVERLEKTPTRKLLQSAQGSHCGLMSHR